jgi:hypothetical protein
LRQHDAQRAQGFWKLNSRKTALYENCSILSPGGELMCHCNRRKIQWYLDRDLATLVCENPPTIQLRFQPRGLGHAGDEFYLRTKQNNCVVCGSPEKFIRHSIIPHAFRCHFPGLMSILSSKVF